MDAFNQDSSNDGEDAGNNLERLPVQPRQPQNLQGLLRFAIEARQDTPDSSPDEIVPMDAERREFLAEALQNMVMDAVVVLRNTIPILSDPQKIGSLANKEEITPEIKTAFESVCDIVEDLDVSNDFCKMGGFDIFPLCYNTPNPELWENTNILLARVCQNFEPAQALVVERGLLKKMLDLMREPDTKCMEKFVYAVSCCVRGNVPASEAMVELGGCEVLSSLLGGGEFRLVIRASCFLRHLIQEFPGAKERVIAVNLPKILVSHLEKPVVQDTEHLLHLLRASVDFPEIVSQCRNPDLRLKPLLQKILNTPNVLIEQEQNREIIEYAKEVLSIVFVNEGMPVYDCEEEADR